MSAAGAGAPEAPPEGMGPPAPAAGDGQGGAAAKKIQPQVHPEHIHALASHLAPRRAVVSYEETGSWTVLTLECGHTAEIAAHFDPRHSKVRRCHRCGHALALEARS